MKKLSNDKIRLGGLVAALALLAAPAWAESSYTFPSVVEGPATVVGAAGERESVEAHRPILVGDRLWVPYDSRLELVLPDFSLLRAFGESEIGFESVAFSADTDDRATVLDVRRGHLQLVVPEDALGDSLPQLVTPDATIYVHEPGTYRLTVSDRGWTELVVRDGRAEIVGDRGSSLVHRGDMALAQGGSRPTFEVRLAGRYDELELWGEDLTREAELAQVPHVDDSLRYVSAPLASHGGWVSIGSRWAWRPRVELSWRPYGHGYWRTTPVGPTWVSYEPWGYVTHHYGLWDYVPGYGWVWYPGSVYRPAWVHWYWGPEYVGWCPSGYYASFYGGPGYYGHRRAGLSLSFGIYGWAGGSWGRFDHWSFVSTAHFGDRHQDRHVRRARDMERLVSSAQLHKGIITSDPGRAGRDPAEVYRRLREDAERHERATGRRLPDVSDFVARKPLAGDLREAVLKPKPVTASKPAAASRPAVASKPGSVSRQLPARPPRTSAAPRDPMPRVDERTGREAPRVDRDDVSRAKPTTKPGLVERPDERRAEPSRPSVTPRDVERYKQPTRTAPSRPEPSRPSVTPRDVERYKQPARTAPSPRESSRPTVTPSAPAKPAPRAVESAPSSRRSAVDRAKSGSDREKGSKPSVSAKKPRKKDKKDN